MIQFNDKDEDTISIELTEASVEEEADKKVPTKNRNRSTRTARVEYDTIDTMEVDSLADSLSSDSLIAFVDTIDTGTELIRQDRMIASRIIQVENSESSEPSQRDSLLSDLVDRGNPVSDHITEYTLEFWQSPLNYKGYKIIRNRIILFGLDPQKDYVLRLEEEKLILDCPDGSSRTLRVADDFIAL